MNATRQSLSETLSRAQRAFLTVADQETSTSDEPSDQPAIFAVAPTPSPSGVAFESQITGRDARDIAKRPPESLRSVTLRLRTSVAEALRRESIKHSLDYVEPFSQQAIVETAVRTWLQAHGCAVNE